MKMTAPHLAEVFPEDFPENEGADVKFLYLLNFTIHAPSSHNAQPWLFRIQGHELDLIADRNRAVAFEKYFSNRETAQFGLMLKTCPRKPKGKRELL